MAYSRRLQYADRVALQQADQAIRKDVLRALVEIITNSNDSYARLEQSGREVSGDIIVEVRRKMDASVIRIRDFAEGMNDKRMDRVVGTYGAATSGIKEDKHVRGMWGRSLKDAIFGLGYGYVRSFREGRFYESSLLLKEGVPTFDLESPKPATTELRHKYGIEQGNGTEVEIAVSRQDVKMPQFYNLRNYLQRHFELRPILANPRRRVILRNLDSSSRIREEYMLTYKPPHGEKVLNKRLKIKGYPAKVHLQVFRSNIQLSTRSEEGDYADGGLLVISESMVIALTMLKFEDDPYASYFYGTMRCDYLHELLKNDEPVLTATRDGLNWSHPFAKEMKSRVEKILEPLVQQEREQALQDEQARLDVNLRQKLDEAIDKLNTIALTELEEKKDRQQKLREMKEDLPPSGFGFVPEQAYVQTGRDVTLTLRAEVSRLEDHGSVVMVDSNNAEVTVLTPEVVLKSRKNEPSIAEARVKVEGRQVGSTGVITAHLNGFKARAQVQVRSKKEIFKPTIQKRARSLFSDIRFEDRTDARQRVYVDRVNSSIVVATGSPSVKIYLDKNNRLDTSLEGRVLLAELITEAVCREIAREGVERGNFLATDGSEADAIQSHFIRLQNQYAHMIHKVIVKME